jgi:hypothetical protein
MNEDWISVNEAALLLKEAPNTVRARIKSGELPVVGKVSDRIIVLSRKQVEALAAQRSQAVA